MSLKALFTTKNCDELPLGIPERGQWRWDKMHETLLAGPTETSLKHICSNLTCREGVPMEGTAMMDFDIKIA